MHEHGTFSVLLVRPAPDPVLAQLRHEAAFTAACRAIPGLADWVDPGRARPITPVLPGGPLLNAYRGQAGPDGKLALPGLVFVGDAVATTTPTFGRGVTTTLLQAQELLRLIDEHGTDVATTLLQARQLLQLIDDHGTDAVAVGESFDAWCAEQIKPWVDDHVHMDDSTRRRWAGQDIDLDLPLPSDLILAAAQADPGILGASFGYLGMTALPASLRAVEPRARTLYSTGRRPAPATGPTRDELADIIQMDLPTAPVPASI